MGELWLGLARHGTTWQGLGVWSLGARGQGQVQQGNARQGKPGYAVVWAVAAGQGAACCGGARRG